MERCFLFIYSDYAASNFAEIYEQFNSQNYMLQFQERQGLQIDPRLNKLMFDMLKNFTFQNLCWMPK